MTAITFKSNHLSLHHLNLSSIFFLDIRCMVLVLTERMRNTFFWPLQAKQAKSLPKRSNPSECIQGDRFSETKNGGCAMTLNG